MAAWDWCQKKVIIILLDIVNGAFFFPLGQQVNTQRKAIVQLILEKRELLVGQRVKRDGNLPQLHFPDFNDTNIQKFCAFKPTPNHHRHNTYQLHSVVFFGKDI